MKIVKNRSWCVILAKRAVFLFFLFVNLCLYAESVTVSMFSHLDFVPGMLEMVTKDLEQCLNCRVNINFIPVRNLDEVSIRKKVDFLLIENGLHVSNTDKYYKPLRNYELSLVWVLGVNEKGLKALNGKPINNLKDFYRMLYTVKKADSSIYPWFESIYSKNTFYNLNLVLKNNGKNHIEIYNKKGFWHYNSPIRILYEAMVEKLLNPLSLESDESLAFEVFTSGDCAASSFWVPLEYLTTPALVKKSLGKVKLFPFPANGKTALIPKITFNFWQNKNNSNKVLAVGSCLAKNIKFNVKELRFNKIIQWINDKYTELYDKLVVGDF